jgi:hypothetical protein
LKILFIDHSFHQKTKSTNFFSTILEGLGMVHCEYDDSWRGGPSVANDVLLDSKWSIIVFFQILPNEEQLSYLPAHKTVVVPMFDNYGDYPLSFWLKYINCKILSFSTTIYKRLTSFGFDVFCLQYFPEPAPALPTSTSPYTKRKAFFWERTDFLTSSMVMDFLRPLTDFNLHIHQAADPGHTSTIIDEKELQGGRVKLSQWFETKSDLETVIQDCVVYFAPRRLEGIGMSFLEAMAQGKVVIANNRPTMSEYIVSGVNGILVDWQGNPRLPKHIDFEEMGRAAAEFIAAGHKRYRESIPRLLEWLPQHTVVRGGLFGFKRVCYRLAIGAGKCIRTAIRFPFRVMKRLGQFKNT